MNISVIKSGGKQYLVTNGQKLHLEKLNAEDGADVAFDTLLTADDAGNKVEIGTPTVKDKTKAKVITTDRAKKVTVVKYKSKTRYKRTVGHRQPYTIVAIQ